MRTGARTQMHEMHWFLSHIHSLHHVLNTYIYVSIHVLELETFSMKNK